VKLRRGGIQCSGHRVRYLLCRRAALSGRSSQMAYVGVSAVTVVSVSSTTSCPSASLVWAVCWRSTDALEASCGDITRRTRCSPSTVIKISPPTPYRTVSSPAELAYVSRVVSPHQSLILLISGNIAYYRCKRGHQKLDNILIFAFGYFFRVFSRQLSVQY